MNKTSKVLNTLLLLSFLGLLAGCGSNGMGGTGIEPGISDAPEIPEVPASEEPDPEPTPEPIPEPETIDVSVEAIISPVTLPLSDNGYSNFETLVLSTQEQYDAFIDDVTTQNSWNGKELFLQQLQSRTINFTNDNVLIYRFLESSGSTIVTPSLPELVNNQVIVNIDRQVSTVGTADVVYYAIAYLVDSSLTEIVFDNGTSEVTVDLTNTPSEIAQGKLIRSDSESLLSYFQETAKEIESTPILYDDGFPIALPTEAEPTIAAPDDSFGDSSNVSTTNLQEKGVDEADLIKTDGRYLYSIDKSANASGDKIRIMDTQSTTGLNEIENINSDNASLWNIKGLYLHETQKRLVALSSSYDSFYKDWFDSFSFSNKKTDVMFVNVDDPSAASVTTKLSFDGTLIDSRRNGDVLYMVLRHYSNYRYLDDERLASTSNDDFLPTYSIDDAPSQLTTQPENCFVQQGPKRGSDVITIVAVDLSTTKPQVDSKCYIGSTEAIYASQNALYLATTTNNYEILGDIAEYVNETSIDIHKFAYEGLNVDYRGSGEVDGHLGFSQISKSFRFSEHDGFLRVVTFDKDQWDFRGDTAEDDDKSPVLLSILEENTSTQALDLVSTLPNENRPDPIGLPDERLYATRFIGNRGYFITFQKVDPLYVLDLSDHTDPLILGELKIDGYSDYLHPISENLLVGIGKDAALADSGDFSWYQGVKLSLLDVTDPTNPREADNIIIGKRGTESTALTTHHGVTGLNVNDIYRLAIPVRLHADISLSEDEIVANTQYDYTHTGLYRFNIDINSQTIESIAPLVAETADDIEGSYSYSGYRNDRSVIINDDVFYMHDGQFWMQDWEGTADATGPK